MSHSWVLKRGGNIIKQFLKRQNFFSNLVSLSCLWRVRNIDVSNSFSSLETACFRAKENFQIYFLQTASDVRNIVLNLFSCFWRVRNVSNLFSSTCFWSVRNIDVSNLSSSSETACFWASENFQIYLPHQKQLVSERQKIFKFMFFKLLLTRQKFFKFIFSSTCFFQICFLI